VLGIAESGWSPNGRPIRSKTPSFSSSIGGDHARAAAVVARKRPRAGAIPVFEIERGGDVTYHGRDSSSVIRS